MLKKVLENKYFIYDHPRKKGILYFAKYCITGIENVFYNICFCLVRKKRLSRKYKVTICAIFKNEAPYLKEWIEYHRIIGVEHFYLYNNNSSDDFQDVLQPYINSNKVTLIDFPKQHAQKKAYQDCINKYRKEAEWIGFIDIDEFVVPVKDNNIIDFLNRFKKYPAVKIYWKVFGTSGIIDRDINGLVVNDFRISWPKYDEVGKCFYNTSFDVNLNSKKMSVLHHNFWGVWHKIALPPVNCFGFISQHGFEKVKNKDFPIQINHYFTKSYNEYFNIKAIKGDVWYKENQHPKKSYFFRHEMLCTKRDDSINKYLIKLKLIMKK